jgi:hypothetical protein
MAARLHALRDDHPDKAGANGRHANSEQFVVLDLRLRAYKLNNLPPYLITNE